MSRALTWWLGIGLGAAAARSVSGFGYLSHGWAAAAWWVATAATFAFVTAGVVAVVERLFLSGRRRRRAPAAHAH